MEVAGDARVVFHFISTESGVVVPTETPCDPSIDSTVYIYIYTDRLLVRANRIDTQSVQQGLFGLLGLLQIANEGW